MNAKTPSSDFIPERCQYRTATGRQCCSSVVDPSSSFCSRHAASEPGDTEDFNVPLTQQACCFQNAQGINHSLGALYTFCAQGRISPRRASTLAYISSLLLRTLTAIDNDLYPKARDYSVRRSKAFSLASWSSARNCCATISTPQWDFRGWRRAPGFM